MNYQQFLDSEIVSTRALGAGTSGSGTVLTRLTLKDGRELVAKEARQAFDELELEAWMLGYLAKHSSLSVPGVWHAEGRLMIMDYLPGGGSISAAVEEQAADALAALHAINADTYGLERDTLIGPLPQRNTQEVDWLTFFAEHRLIYMARMALEAGRMDPGTMVAVERLCARLDDYITNPNPPSLIHGDLWTGNVICGNGQLSGFIDPAIYYADPEIELAFTTLFGTFGDAFFRRYQEHRPLQPGFFETRRDLYNLYPLLVHVRLFGGGYLGQVQSILRRLV